VDDERESLLEQVVSHGPAHQAQSDESDSLRHWDILTPMPSFPRSIDEPQASDFPASVYVARR
jgi:hypothetical protein